MHAFEGRGPVRPKADAEAIAQGLARLIDRLRVPLEQEQLRGCTPNLAIKEGLIPAAFSRGISELVEINSRNRGRPIIKEELSKKLLAGYLADHDAERIYLAICHVNRELNPAGQLVDRAIYQAQREIIASFFKGDPAENFAEQERRARLELEQRLVKPIRQTIVAVSCEGEDRSASRLKKEVKNAISILAGPNPNLTEVRRDVHFIKFAGDAALIERVSELTTGSDRVMVIFDRPLVAQAYLFEQLRTISGLDGDCQVFFLAVVPRGEDIGDIVRHGGTHAFRYRARNGQPAPVTNDIVATMS